MQKGKQDGNVVQVVPSAPPQPGSALDRLNDFRRFIEANPEAEFLFAAVLPETDAIAVWVRADMPAHEQLGMAARIQQYIMSETSLGD
jgi:hypothetical protein